MFAYRYPQVTGSNPVRGTTFFSFSEIAKTLPTFRKKKLFCIEKISEYLKNFRKMKKNVVANTINQLSSTWMGGQLISLFYVD